MDQGLPRPAPRQGRRRPHHPQGPHHRHRHRVLALPPRARAPGEAPQAVTRAPQSPTQALRARRLSPPAHRSAPIRPLRAARRPERGDQSRPAALRPATATDPPTRNPSPGPPNGAPATRFARPDGPRSARGHTPYVIITTHPSTDAKWGHLKRPRWGQCKRPLRDGRTAKEDGAEPDGPSVERRRALARDLDAGRRNR